MLNRYFGFRDDPFGSTPDPGCLHLSPTHREALASLKYGFHANRGFTLLIATPGMGKTTLLFRFLQDIRDTARCVFLFDIDPMCEPRELVGYILRDLGITPAPSSAEMHIQLNEVLVAEALAGRRVVVVIDEAQNLSELALEMVRLLTNFETSRAKLVQVVLSGQPQLSDKLMLPSLLQLRQRISTICRLEVFSAKETDAYIAHRLKVAGYEGGPLFTQDALGLITKASQGIPRNINTLCFNSLSICCAMKSRQVNCAMVAEAIADQQLMQMPAEPLAAHPETRSEIRPRQVVERRRARTRPTGPSRLWFPVTAVLLVAFALGLIGLSELQPPQSRTANTRSALDSHRTPSVTTEQDGLKTATGIVPSPSIAANSENADQAGAASASHAESFEITVEPHQSLEDISLRYLGGYDRVRLRQIQNLNPKLTDPDHILAGQRIMLPGSPEALVAIGASSPAKVRNTP